MHLTFTYCKIVTDNEMGVNYLYASNGTSGGLTVLLDSDGRPIITKGA
ncbi:DUF6440 family protein [Clostridium sp. UBA1056]